MLLYPKTTAVLKTGEVRSTKSIHALLIATIGGFDALTNELITIWVERVNRSNVYLATNVKLSDFIALTNFDADSIQSDDEYAMIAICQLAENSNVQLNEGEQIKFKIDGLRSAETYAVWGLEEPASDYDFYTFDRKTIASEDLQKVVTLDNSEVTVFSTNSVEEITIEYGNGAKTRFTPFELRTVTRDVDPVFIVGRGGIVSQGIANKIVLPSFGVKSIEIAKSVGTLVEVTSRVSSNLLNV